jgi:hypothetical protein
MLMETKEEQEKRRDQLYKMLNYPEAKNEAENPNGKHPRPHTWKIALSEEGAKKIEQAKRAARRDQPYKTLKKAK